MILATLHEHLLRRRCKRPLLGTAFEALGQATKDHCMETLRVRQALAHFVSTPTAAIDRTGAAGDFHLFDVVQTAKQGVQVQTGHTLISDQQLVTAKPLA